MKRMASAGRELELRENTDRNEPESGKGRCYNLANMNENERTEQQKQQAGTPETKAPVKKAADGAAEEAKKPQGAKKVVRKKKNIIQVFHPQNASSKEAKNYKGAQPQRKPSAKRAESKNTSGNEEKKRARPLVKVPRAHPPASAYEPESRAIPASEKPEVVGRKPEREKTAPAKEVQKPAAAASAAPEQAAASAAEAKTAPAAAAKAAPAPEQTAAARKEERPRREQRPAAASQDGQNRRQERPAGARSERPARAEGQSGRDGKRDDARKRPARGESRPVPANAEAAPAKQGRGGRNDKDKDKNKSLRKENKFANDRGQNRNKRGKQAEQPAITKPVRKKEEKKVEKVKEIRIPDKLTIRELAEKMKVQASAIVKKLFMQGLMVTVNQEIDFDKAEEIAMDYDIIAEHEEKVDVIAELLKDEEDNEAKMVARPPVVCVMGHVDHGKTSLLDAIRDTHVTDREAGGITQSIGAYVVEINGQKITFLDTPGHEAFTAMRMRGANSTDIAVLVVAADDGVMPQTVEAINHAKAAGVEIIVAINKIDKPNANVERVKQELSEYELIPEDWGGSTIFAPVSAKSHEGIDNLLEMILLTAEVMELKADPDRKARALVLEAKLDKGKGPVASVLVQKGTLHVGDYIACGAASGRVRAMMDENGHQVRKAGPSRPVEVQGLSEVPNAGEVLLVTDTDKEAKNIASTFVTESRNKLLEETRSRMSLDDLFSQIHEGDVKELNIVVKADVQGSVEAVRQSLEKLSNEEVAVKIVHGGVGAINESDVTLAVASNAIIIGFNVNPDATAKASAQQEKIDVRLYKVIYKAIEDVEAAMKGMLAPMMEEKILGHAEIRQLFRASGVGTIAGSYVLDGTIERGCMVRVTRENKKIFEGNLASLKRFKDDVKEVRSGFECGLVFEDFNEVEEFDRVEAYKMVEVPRL